VFHDLRTHVTAVHGFMPPYSTFNVGILSGGTALNIIPEDACLVWEFRTIPEIDSEALSSRIHRYLQGHLLSRLKAQFPGAAVLSRQLAHVPPLRPSYNRVARDVMCSITRLTGDGAVAYGTKAGIFQQARCPTVVCGPGTIDVANKANEHIALEQLARCNQAIEAIVAFCRRP
jgi:acetylornithine deacetylase